MHYLTLSTIASRAGAEKLEEVIAANYDDNHEGNLASTQDPAGNVVRASYDLKGRKIQSVDPDMGTWNYVYDALGQLVQQINARGQIAVVSYDAGGRVVARAEPDLSSSWSYDNCTNGIGALCSKSTNTGFSQSYTYDSLSRPQVTTTTVDTTYTASVAYDANGRISSQTYPTGAAVNFNYTPLGYLQTIVDASVGTTYWQANTMDAEGRLTQMTYGNGVVTNPVFNPQTGRLTSVTAGPGSGTGVENIGYTYDFLGNVLTRQDVNQSLTETFQYDPVNRVWSAAVSSAVAGNHTVTYGYNNIGNLTSRSDLGTYTYGPVNSLPHAVTQIALSGGGTSFVYDADGNMTAGNGRIIGYTSFDMPSTISQSAATDTFSYGPDHQRTTRTTSTGITVELNPGNSGALFYEKDMNLSHATQEERLYISAGGGPVVMLKRQNGSGTYRPYYLHRDNLGSTVAVTNSTGALIEQLSYEPFGKRRFVSGAADTSNTIKGLNTDRGFTDHEHLDDLGLIHMNGRVFDPLTARFLSADPNVQFAGDLQSYNRYSYVSNNPLNTVDPSGYLSFRSLLGDLSGAANQNYRWGLHHDPLHRYTTQYLASHQWAYTLATVVAAAATEYYCGGCGAAIVDADVTAASTGSVGRGLRAGAITYAESEVLRSFGGNNGESAAVSGMTAKQFITTVAHNYEEAEIRQLFAKIAARNGVSLLEVDAILEGVSLVGDAILGDRLERPNEKHPDDILIKGILTRGPFTGASVPFDIADIALAVQGLPTGTTMAYGK
jgi:RHS repeat-associated protein